MWLVWIIKERNVADIDYYRRSVFSVRSKIIGIEDGVSETIGMLHT